MKKSPNFSIFQRAKQHTPLFFFLWLAFLSLPTAAKNDKKLETNFLTHEGAKALVGCDWEETCSLQYHKSLVQPEHFFERSANRHFFARWHDLWEESGSPEQDWDGNYTYRYYILVRDPSDLHSALLVLSRRAIVHRIYRIRSDGLEEEIHPFSSNTTPPARKLVYLSRFQAKVLVGCEWGQECNSDHYASEFLEERLLNINSFFFNHQNARDTWNVNPWLQGLFERWFILFKASDPKGYYHPIDTWDIDGFEYSIYHPEPIGYGVSLSRASLLESKKQALVGIFRILVDGTEVEYRPPYEEPSLNSKQYSSIDFQLNSFSSQTEDITSVAYYYNSNKELRKKFGFDWEAAFSVAEKSLTTIGFDLQNPRHFFSEKKWHMPTWKATMIDADLNGALSQGAWTYHDSTFYLFTKQDYSTVLILEFTGDPRELTRIIKHKSGGITEMHSPSENSIKREFETPILPLEEKVPQNLRLNWGVNQKTVQNQYAGKNLCTLSLSLTIDDPASFFQTRGRAFKKWRNEIDALKKNHQFEYSTDRTWTSQNGNKFMVRRDSCWESEFEIDGKPQWQILEFQDDKLVRVYLYDSLWRERVFEEQTGPSLEEIFGESVNERLKRVKEDPQLLTQTKNDLESHWRPEDAQEALSKITKLQDLRNKKPPSSFRAAHDSGKQGEKLTDIFLTSSIWGISSILALIVLLAISIILRRSTERRRAAEGKRFRDMGFD